MNTLTPLETLYDNESGKELPLPADLAELYGSLRFAPHPGRPYTIGNFVTTLDGVVALNAPGHQGGGEISGFNKHDQMVMGLLRAVSDAVIVGAGTLRSVPQHLWTADYIYPPLAPSYQALRESLDKPPSPLNVIVTGSGQIDPTLPVFQSGQVPVLIVTTLDGWQRLRAHNLPQSVQIAAVKGDGTISARAVVGAANDVSDADTILVEGGPHLMGDFFAEQCLDELFLTLSPQVAGRDEEGHRLALVEGKALAPDQPVWGKLASVKRGGSHLFLRYGFESED